MFLGPIKKLIFQTNPPCPIHVRVTNSYITYLLALLTQVLTCSVLDHDHLGFSSQSSHQCSEHYCSSFPHLLSQDDADVLYDYDVLCVLSLDHPLRLAVLRDQALRGQTQPALRLQAVQDQQARPLHGHQLRHPLHGGPAVLHDGLHHPQEWKHHRLVTQVNF